MLNLDECNLLLVSYCRGEELRQQKMADGGAHLGVFGGGAPARRWLYL